MESASPTRGWRNPRKKVSSTTPAERLTSKRTSTGKGRYPGHHLGWLGRQEVGTLPIHHINRAKEP